MVIFRELFEGMISRFYGIAAFFQQFGSLYGIQWHFRQFPVERIGLKKAQMLLHIMFRAMVRIGDVEFPDPLQSLYFRSEEAVSQILQIALFVDSSFIRGRQVNGTFGSLYGDDGLYLTILPVIR
mgnify:CR=1 FL=1